MPTTDTSWLYALLDELDGNHADAMAQAKAADRLTVPLAILAEFLQLVHHRVRQASSGADAHLAGRQALRDLQAISSLVFQPEGDPGLASAIYVRHGKLSYADCVAIASALRSRQELLTFDRRQRSAWMKERAS